MIPIETINRDKWSFPGGIIERHGIGKPWTVTNISAILESEPQ